MVASILSVFTISKDTDELGNEIPVKPSFGEGLVSHPNPYKCRIVPRSLAATELLRPVPNA